MHRLDSFLLESDLAKELYDSVKDLPIIDVHTEISPRAIYKNVPYENLTQLWLKNDHYKWRLMRNSGVLEYQITGDDSDLHKFQAYAGALERAYLNPLHHWSHMELESFFGIDVLLTKNTAEEIYQTVETALQENETGPRDLLAKAKVEVLFTNEDVNDDLEFHKLIKDDKSFEFQVLPIFRPDKMLDINSDDFLTVITLLEKNTSTTISGITTLATALSKRLDYFNVNGCSVANHHISEMMYFEVSKSEASKILKKRLMEYQLTTKEEHQFRLYLLKFFLKEYAIRDMVCQLHIGALHNANTRMHKQVDQNGGYDAISTHSFVNELNQLLSEIHSHYPLPKLVIYHLNPSDNEAVASLCGNFSCEHPGKIQFGGAWWFNNHEQGITNQLTTYGYYLNLATYTGMPSNAKTETSMVRHDYFRRILANTIAFHVETGRIPNDKDNLIKLMQDIAYNNRKHYYNL